MRENTSVGAGEKNLLFYSYVGEIYYILYEGDKTINVP